ncbi:hypothetical protein [Amycolatopsis sp. PS_44_ISF1]|uniref:hypothetical protein n=1 Tax=Amycolatopsis sp. PS_44_ISF1 TaxID=2974917 RepID=UPI0028DDA472|nr:hypothetical protein [Amycolatopsis sp. PS_44_ISF1]MDT8913434.1 hypothetical protein [Amycolatopsis sp. PS_44_ISF1]
MVLSRRGMLLGTVGLGAAAGFGLALPAGAAASVTPPAGPFPPLPPLPAGAPVRKLFTPSEQRFGPYLAILPGMVNDVEVADAAKLGYLGGGWWRTPSGPTNARVQEHVFTLSWFHANARSWNPYSGDAALLHRLEAAITHYLNLQHADGSWPEYSATEQSKAATGFGLGYLAKTLANLRRARALPTRRGQIGAALHRGMTWFLDPANPIWASPVHYANQNTAGLAGSTLALELDPDAAMQAKLADRIAYLAAHGQSPAGFFYEPTGMDINYNFEVMLSELAEIHVLTGDRTVLSMAEKFASWFAHTIVREPDGSGSLAYTGMSARTTVTGYDDVIPDRDRTSLASFFVPEVPALAPFFTSAEDRAATRAAWGAASGPSPGLAKQDTSPRIIAHAPYGESLPSKAAKQAAITQLPYLVNSNFAVQRRDNGTDQAYTFVRRPGLYLAAFFGTRPSSKVRGSAGLLWHPAAGAIVQSQQADTECWASLLPGGNPDARSDLDATYQVGGRVWDGRRISPGSAPVVVDYALPDGRIRTTLTITPNTVTRAVRGTSALTEQVPLVLKPTDSVSFSDGTPIVHGRNTTATATGLTIRRGGRSITFHWGTALAASVTATSVAVLSSGGRRIHVLRVPHGGTLSTVITLP